jgi:hypothetical protein
MKISHRRGDVLPFRHTADETCSAVEDELQFVELVLRQSIQQSIAIVKARKYK